MNIFFQELLMEHNFTEKLRNSLLWAGLLTAGLFAAEKCELVFTTCPETFSAETLTVPEKTIAIAAKVHACKSTQVIQTTQTTGATPSIVFIIDNSGSMKGSTGNDQWGSRFTVTKALLDTLFKAQPQTEVGLIVFREHLFFDTTTTSQFYYTKYFKALSPVLDSEPDQAYLPFMTLNQTYDGKQGIDIIKDILATDTLNNSTDLVYQPLYRNLRPNNGGGETNINGAFIAAKEAFLTAKNPKDQQYIIFLSDGAPAGSTQAGYPQTYFETPAGVANVPTTFTVFFNKGGGAPASLVTMTDNVKINGYSATNPKSDLWTLATSFDALLNLLMNNVIKTILVPANPTRMIINGETSTTYVPADSSFTFPDSFPIGSNVTSFTMNISYKYTIPSTGVSKDTVDTITFYIRRSGQAAPPPGTGLVCQQYVKTIPVTAILFDTSGDGHLDRIDIVWQDTDQINPTMPAITDFIQTLQITSLDGVPVTLTAVSLVPDLANKTIHVVLRQNTGPILETGWLNATITLKPIPMNVNHDSPFEVIDVIDSAGPVIKAVYYIPMKDHDSIVVIFSEPVDWSKSNPNTNAILDFLKTLSPFPVGDINPDPTKTQELPNKIIYTIPVHNDNFRQFVDSLKAILPPGGVPSIVDTKGNKPPVNGGPPCPVQLIVNTRVVIEKISAFPNPFVPPPAFTTAPGAGIRIQAHLAISIPDVQGFSTVSGTMTVYDVVGNAICKNQNMIISKDTVATFWSGYTSRGTKAATGTYVAILVIRNSADGSSDTKTVNIGVQRK